MDTKKDFTCGLAEHKKHMCALQAAGKIDEMQALSSHPTVECGVCGARADSPDNVCTPAKVYEDEQIA